MRRLVLALILAVAGCAGTPVVYTHGIPHLLQVPGHPNAYRSGAVPATEEAFRYLDQLGVSRIYELERGDEEADHAQVLDLAAEHHVEVVSLAMPPYTNPKNPLEYLDAEIGPSDEQQKAVVDAVMWVRSHPDRVVLGHCHNGNDRTGDFAGTLVLDQVTVSESHAYMVETGFHDALVGLLVQWWRYAESARP